MGNSCTSVFPNTRAWEQQDWNKTVKQRKKVRREEWVWKEVQRTRKKKSCPVTLSSPVTSVTHDSQSRSPSLETYDVLYPETLCTTPRDPNSTHLRTRQRVTEASSSCKTVHDLNLRPTSAGKVPLHMYWSVHSCMSKYMFHICHSHTWSLRCVKYQPILITSAIYDIKDSSLGL